MKPYQKSLTIALACISAMSWAHAEGNRRMQRATAKIQQVLSAGALTEGAYAGFASDEQKSEYTLIVKSLASHGRDESYLGILLLTDATDRDNVMPATLNTSLYVIDPLDRKGEYMMVPMTLGPANVGTFNDEPTLSLSMTSSRIAINPTRSSNEAGFREQISLGHDALFSMQGATTGPFARGAHKSSVSKDLKTADIQASSQGLSLNGNYSLTEVVQGLSLVKGRKIDTYGEQEDRQPLGLATFLSFTQNNRPTTAMVFINLKGKGASPAFSLISNVNSEVGNKQSSK